MKSNIVALAAIAAFGAGSAFAQGMPSTPSTGPSSSSPSSSSPSTSSGTPASGGSGYLTAPDKASKAELSNAGDKFGVLDKDHDGMVSKAESRKDKDLKGQFDTLDANKDGKLDQSEFAQFEVGSSSTQKSSGK